MKFQVTLKNVQNVFHRVIPVPTQLIVLAVKINFCCWMVNALLNAPINTIRTVLESVIDAMDFVKHAQGSIIV